MSNQCYSCGNIGHATICDDCVKERQYPHDFRTTVLPPGDLEHYMGECSRLKKRIIVLQSQLDGNSARLATEIRERLFVEARLQVANCYIESVGKTLEILMKEVCLPFGVEDKVKRTLEDRLEE